MKIAAFTLVELMTAVVIIAILAAMLLGIWSNLRQRADRALCVSNLKNLYTTAATYLQQEGHWPQIDPALLQDDDKLYARAWIETFKPYGLSYPNWICPSVQRLMSNPDVTKSEFTRIDYVAQPFDDRAMAPYEYPTQPWFAERGDIHGDGNLVIFTNGQISSLREIFLRQR